MAFSDFVYPEVCTQLGLEEASSPNLFERASPVAATATLRSYLASASRLALAINNEKARSEWLIAPVLAMIGERFNWQISIFSGAEFPGDPEANLTVYCDFLIGRGPQLPHIVAPVAVIIEAKREDIIGGLGQCIAAMVGAQRFNVRHARGIDTIYGCVTSGTVWRFLQLKDTLVTQDLIEYPLADLDKLLGIFSFMLGPVPKTVAA